MVINRHFTPCSQSIVCAAIWRAVHHDDIMVGGHFEDLMVREMLLVESKIAKVLVDAHRMRCINHLKATGLRHAVETTHLSA